MEFTFYGHACFAVKAAGKTILFDPFITYNELAKGIDVNAIEADYILISHGHQDHVADAESIAKRTGAKVVASWEVAAWFNAKGVTNTHPMNTGGSWTFEGFTVACTVAQHSSSMPDGSYGGNPMGFVITTDDCTFYYSGDTALTMDMKLIPMLYPKLKFAVLPIGNNFTMDTKQAVIAADFVECSTVVGIHFDTFGYIKIDHEAAIASFKAAGKTLILPTIGETITL